MNIPPGTWSLESWKAGYVLKETEKNISRKIFLFQNLKNSDLIGKAPDAYVQVIAFDGHKAMKTKTIKNSSNPVWNEEFRFELGLDTVSSYTVKLRVYDDDTMSKDDALGEVIIPLWQVDFSTGVEELRTLQKISKVDNLETFAVAKYTLSEIINRMMPFFASTYNHCNGDNVTNTKLSRYLLLNLLISNRILITLGFDTFRFCLLKALTLSQK